jgi:predicted transposase YbfD/YdcC
VLSPLAFCDPAGDAARPASVAADLLDYFAAVPDHRAQRWVDHPLAAVLALCAAAVVAGMRSFTAIAGWVDDTPDDLRAALYGRCGQPAAANAPSKGTLWRVVTEAAAAPVDAAIGAWLSDRAAAAAAPPAGRRQEPDREGHATLTALAADGKTVRGAKDTDGTQVHLLAAMTHNTGLVLAQTDVAAKTNEIPMLPALLDGLDLTGMILTVDALHTQRATADYLHRRGCHFVFTVKENQPRLFAALDALPWTDTPVAHTATDRGHGRITTRTIQVLPAPDDLPFPHINQVFLLERHVTDLHGEHPSAVAALGVTSATADHIDPTHLAGLVRGHWGIESLHWIRDTVYREDNSTAHTRSGPRVMAALRNLAVGAHRLAGRDDISEATRWADRRPHRPFEILGLIN